MMSMMDWSTINIRAARPSGETLFCVSETTFSASNFGFKIGRLFKAQNPAKIAQKAPKTVPQTLPKRIQNSISSYNARNPKKMQPFHTKTSFLTFPDPRKSSQNRCQNALKISFILDTLLEPQKIRFLMLKRRQDGPPKFPIFSKIVNFF